MKQWLVDKLSSLFAICVLTVPLICFMICCIVLTIKLLRWAL